jgi:hypothetical protein
MAMLDDDVTLILSTDPNCAANNIARDELDLGAFTHIIFGADDDFPLIPIISRKQSIARIGETGFGNYRTDMTLSGFFEATDHPDAVKKYLRLEALLSQSYAYFTYSAGDHAVASAQLVYFDELDEPLEWKQHDGSYTISFHYYTNRCDSAINFLHCSYVPLPMEALRDTEYANLETIAADYEEADEEENVHGSYSFRNAPLWTKNIKRQQPAPAYQFSPSGAEFARKSQITLTGFLQGVSHESVMSEMELLENAFAKAGILNYGTWSGLFYPDGNVQFSQVMPDFYVQYTVAGESYDTEIYELRCSRSFSRTHRHPLIRPRKYCYITNVYEFHESGQTVSYSMSLKAKDRKRARQLLYDEFRAFVTEVDAEDMVLMEGGAEKWSDDNTIELNCTYYYREAILRNIEELDYENPIPEEIYAE